MAISVFDYCDDIGPRAIVHVHEPRVGLKGIVVIDNVAAGPAIGGTRMAPDVSLDECFRLARAMTFKNASAGLPHGGAKSVIAADPLMDQDKKERVLRAFAKAIKPLTDYVPGPDMGTNENAMAIIRRGGRARGTLFHRCRRDRRRRRRPERRRLCGGRPRRRRDDRA